MQHRQFQVGDKVTAKSIPAKSQLLGIPTRLELANYPSLIGVELTISEITEDWIICTRASGTTTPGLQAADLELLGRLFLGNPDGTTGAVGGSNFKVHYSKS